MPGRWRRRGWTAEGVLQAVRRRGAAGDTDSFLRRPRPGRARISRPVAWQVLGGSAAAGERVGAWRAGPWVGLGEQRRFRVGGVFEGAGMACGLAGRQRRGVSGCGVGRGVGVAGVRPGNDRRVRAGSLRPWPPAPRWPVRPILFGSAFVGLRRRSSELSSVEPSGGTIESGGAGRRDRRRHPDQCRRHRADDETHIVHHGHRGEAAACLAVGDRRDRHRGGVRRHHRQSFMDVVQRCRQPQAGEHHESAEECRRNQAETRKHGRYLDFPVSAEGRVCITESPGRKYEIVAAMRREIVARTGDPPGRDARCFRYSSLTGP